MRVVCDIKVGRRSILEYVLNPITRVMARACASHESRPEMTRLAAEALPLSALQGGEGGAPVRQRRGE